MHVAFPNYKRSIQGRTSDQFSLPNYWYYNFFLGGGEGEEGVRTLDYREEYIITANAHVL